MLFVYELGVIEADPIDDSQVMGNQDKETTDEERDQSDEKRSEAMRAFSEQNFEEAIKLYSEAIVLNPQSALLFAKRGQVIKKSFTKLTYYSSHTRLTLVANFD